MIGSSAVASLMVVITVATDCRGPRCSAEIDKETQTMKLSMLQYRAEGKANKEEDAKILEQRRAEIVKDFQCPFWVSVLYFFAWLCRQAFR